MKLSRRDFLKKGAAAAFGGLLGGSFLWANPFSSEKKSLVPSSGAESFLEEKIVCDTVILNSWIIDGDMTPVFQANLAIKDDKIVALGSFPYNEEARVVDAGGRILAPGFIDIHAHTEDYLAQGYDPKMILRQGVTTHIGGNCGSSPKSVEAFFKGAKPLGINLGLLMGYKALRQIFLTDSLTRKSTYNEILQMQERLALELDQGALGFSTGLEYWAQIAGTKEEITSLCEVAADRKKLYATHIRSESDGLLEAFEEMLEIVEKSQVKVQYSHTKASFKKNWPKHRQVLESLLDVRNSGIDIASDVYGYTFSSWDIGTSPLRHSLSEENLRLALTNDLVCIGSDSGLYRGGRANHPRAYGNYPRILRLVLDEELMSLEKIIYKMTGFPAERLQIKDRGLIKEGYKADLILFDPKLVTDRATHLKTNILSEGIDDVWLNGKRVLENGEFTRLMVGEKIV